MHKPTLLTALALLLALTLAAPTTPQPNACPSYAPETVTITTTLDPTQATANASPPTAPSPACALTNTTQPPNTLTPPSGLTLVLIALGEGTQNFSCAGKSADEAPVGAGALAALYDVTCAVAADPSADPRALTSDGKPLIGRHFFAGPTTAEFDVAPLGNTQLKKDGEAPAPDPARDTKWLRLVAEENQGSAPVSEVKEVYRLNTVDGLPPQDCSGSSADGVVTVSYRAQYWFYT